MNMLSNGCPLKVGAAVKLLGAVLLVGVAGGCGGGNLSESALMAKLEAANLTVERLDRNIITYEQLQRIESQPIETFSVKVSDVAGQSQSLTFIQFDKDWKAQAVTQEGVPGFAIKNWFFVTSGSNAEIRKQIEAALH